MKTKDDLKMIAIRIIANQIDEPVTPIQMISLIRLISDFMKTVLDANPNAITFNMYQREYDELLAVIRKNVYDIGGDYSIIILNTDADHVQRIITRFYLADE